LMDAVVVAAATPPAVEEASTGPPRPVRIRVVNRVEDLPTDLPTLGD
jgi:hypothetical protein